MSNATPIRVNIHAASRLANTIRSFKWIVIASQTFVGLMIVVGINADNTNSVPGWVMIPVAFGTLVAALTSWVLLGWFEHTLHLLAKIAENS